MFYYTVLTQAFWLDNELWGTAYSGTGAGRNNPEMQNVPNVGPIPAGVYTVERPSYTHPVEGPVVFNLTPLLGTQVFGRTGFHIHGNNTENDASHGCIILWRPIRERIDKVSETLLTVQ